MIGGTLIMLGDYYGSLAAARLLGRKGLEVFYADHRTWVPGPRSRFVSHRVRSPVPGDIDGYANWLARFGAEHPGLFLYGVSDDLCWILASRRDALGRLFKLYQPGTETIYTLLNKERLYKLAGRLHIPHPQTWFVESEAALDRLAAEVSYPVLIKPRTQIGFYSKTKGSLCRAPEELKSFYREFRQKNRYHQEISQYDPAVEWPLVQEYLPLATTDTFSVSGFVAENGECTMRAAQKVFQRPRKLGIGVGFEARPVRDDIGDWVRRLCRETGYYGVFEVEFVHDGQGGYFLTDFNPRYYGQMAFEIARGLPLPWMAWLGATGNVNELAQVMRESHATKDSALSTQSRYAHSWIMKLLLTTQGMSGRMSREERLVWLEWLKTKGIERFDALKDADDMTPFWMDFFGSWRQFARHPRDFFRKFFLDE